MGGEEFRSLTPPFRFGVVNENVYRGAYPTLQNFRFLNRLGLKMVLSVTPEPPTVDLVDFCALMDIQLVHVPVMRLAPLNAALMANIAKALAPLVNADKHPVYLHCLDGRRISSLVVLILRRLEGWPPQASFAEFFRHVNYNTKALRPVDESERIAEFEKSSKDLGKFLREPCEVEISESLPVWLWAGGGESAKRRQVPGFRFKHNPPLPPLVLQRHNSGNLFLDQAGTGDASSSGAMHSGREGTNSGPTTTASFQGHSPSDLGLGMAALDLHGVDSRMERARRQKLRKQAHP